jgi:hypothetical protein
MIAHPSFTVNIRLLGYTRGYMQAFISRYYQSLFALILVSIVGLAFYSGFLEGQRTDTAPVTLSCNNNILSKLSIPLDTLANGMTANADSASMKSTGGTFVGSKNGTKYYPSTSCTAVKRIKPGNYQWFNSAEDARIEGYTAGKC